MYFPPQSTHVAASPVSDISPTDTHVSGAESRTTGKMYGTSACSSSIRTHQSLAAMSTTASTGDGVTIAVFRRLPTREECVDATSGALLTGEPSSLSTKTITPSSTSVTAIDTFTIESVASFRKPGSDGTTTIHTAVLTMPKFDGTAVIPTVAPTPPNFDGTTVVPTVVPKMPDYAMLTTTFTITPTMADFIGSSFTSIVLSISPTRPTTTDGSGPLPSTPTTSQTAVQKLAPVLGGTLGGTIIIAIFASYFIIRRIRKRRKEISQQSAMPLDTETAFERLGQEDLEASGRSSCILKMKADLTGKEGMQELLMSDARSELAAPIQVDQESSYIGDGIVAGLRSDSLIPKSINAGIDQRQEVQMDEASTAARESFRPEEVARLRQLLAIMQSPQASSATSDSQAELREIREEMQRLRSLMVLQPSSESQRSESDTRSWTTSLPAYDD